MAPDRPVVGGNGGQRASGLEPDGAPPADRADGPPAGDRDGHPVILVPGFSGQDLVYWNVFHRRLERDGFPAFTMTFPGVALQDIRRSARMLARRVEEVLQATGRDAVHLVGHSLGGLAIRAFVQVMDGAPDVAVCATLGTPHQGTLSALPVLVRPGARQMIPGSAFLRELSSRPLHAPFVNVYSPRDSLVVPYGNAVLPGARNHRLGFGGHWGLLFRRAAYEPILHALRAYEGFPSVDGASSGASTASRADRVHG